VSTKEDGKLGGRFVELKGPVTLIVGGGKKANCSETREK